MRHGESQNNILSKISHEAWANHRTAEPELSDKAIRECRQVGTRFSEMGLKFDLMITSCHKRAILSLKHVRETYLEAAAVPCKVMVEIHEENGVNMGGQTFPGMTRSEILQLLPEIQIDAQYDDVVTE